VQHAGSISKEEYMMAFSQAAETFALEDTKTRDEKSRLFELYDVDNSGTMDREEFAHLLLMHFLAVEEVDAAGAAGDKVREYSHELVNACIRIVGWSVLVGHTHISRVSIP
jgi:Ca2+-binding EF-hand superfamily protein